MWDWKQHWANSCLKFKAYWFEHRIQSDNSSSNPGILSVRGRGGGIMRDPSETLSEPVQLFTSPLEYFAIGTVVAFWSFHH